MESPTKKSKVNVGRKAKEIVTLASQPVTSMLDAFPVQDLMQVQSYDNVIAGPSQSHTGDDLVVSSLQELQNNVQSIMSSLKLKDENPSKKKRVTMTILLQAIRNIYHILRINGFVVPEDMLEE